MTETPKLKPREEAPPRVTEKNFHWNADDFSGRSTLVLPVGIKFEECLKPEFWANIAYKFQKDKLTNRPERVGREIKVIAEDWSFWALIIVRAVYERSLAVGVIIPPIPIGMQEVKAPGYDVRWNVGKRVHEIVRKSDNAIVASVKTKEAAADWIAKSAGAAQAA